MSDEAYSSIVQEHLAHPRNAGAMESPDAVGVMANPICGDTMKLMLRISDDHVIEARWQTVGCPPARAASSLATELATGRSLDEVSRLSKDEILAAAGGLPASKLHAAALAADALHKAVAAYRARLESRP